MSALAARPFNFVGRHMVGIQFHPWLSETSSEELPGPLPGSFGQGVDADQSGEVDALRQITSGAIPAWKGLQQPGAPVVLGQQ